MKYDRYEVKLKPNGKAAIAGELWSFFLQRILFPIFMVILVSWWISFKFFDGGSLHINTWLVNPPFFILLLLIVDELYVDGVYEKFFSYDTLEYKIVHNFKENGFLYRMATSSYFDDKKKTFYMRHLNTLLIFSCIALFLCSFKTSSFYQDLFIILLNFIPIFLAIVYSMFFYDYPKDITTYEGLMRKLNAMKIKEENDKKRREEESKQRREHPTIEQYYCNPKANYEEWKEAYRYAWGKSNTYTPPNYLYKQFLKAGEVSLEQLFADPEKLRNVRLRNSNPKETDYFLRYAKEIAERERWHRLEKEKGFIPLSDSPGDKGEKNVDYTLKWWIEDRKSKDSKFKAYMIKKDCKSKYSDACIRLASQNVAEGEPQEFDHLLLTSFGVIQIETKNYSGLIEVIDNASWKKDGEQINSPEFQVKRHELILKDILPGNVPIYSVICIANENAELRFVEKASIPVVNMHHLSNLLDNYCDISKVHGYLDDNVMQSMMNYIEFSKVNKN